MKITDWRAEIDALDQELLQLLNRRAQVALQIGQLKRAAGLPICDPERERAVINKVQAANNGPLDDSAVAHLFHEIIRATRQAETRQAQKWAVVG